MSKGKLQAVLLGVAQDAGVPQAGCTCQNCSEARRHYSKRQLVVCMGLVDRAVGKSWLLDCTPDFREQLYRLKEFAPECRFSGVLITHAHIGHYTGLLHLGKEAMNIQFMPVYASKSMSKFLRCNSPWSQLIEHENIEIVGMDSGIQTKLSAGISVEPVLVPHRQEYTDTFAFVICGAKKKLFYCPDIDSWDGWEHDLSEFVNGVDIALLDGTFFDADELPDRDISEVRHPLVMDTVNRLSGTNCDVRLVHMNHTNALYNADLAHDLSRKFMIKVANNGDWWTL